MKCTRNLGRLTVGAEASSVQRSLHSVLPSQPAGWTVRDKGDESSLMMVMVMVMSEAIGLG